MKAWLKGGAIGLGIWLVLTIAFYLAGIGYACTYTGEEMGQTCLTSFQLTIKDVTDYVGLNILSTPGVYNFWNVLFFILWGIIIGMIVPRIKKK